MSKHKHPQFLKGAVQAEIERIEPIHPKQVAPINKKKKQVHKDASTRAHEYEVPRSISGSQQQRESKQTHNTRTNRE